MSMRSLIHLGRRPALAGCVAALAIGVGACGQLSHPTNADSEGVYVDAGPITYQVQLSRQLNPFNVEDKTYLSGQSASAPSPSELWFGVFLWAENQSESNAATTDSFDIVDTQGHKYYPIPLNPQVNPFAWTSETLRPNAQQPTPGSIAFYGPAQGDELLFKLNNSIYSNRPLTLEIHAPGQAKPSSVSLDL
ncbi:MAG TPA: hypothetical protein VGI87_03270 [Solirubrobacteraceae bacterium]